MASASNLYQSFLYVSKYLFMKKSHWQRKINSSAFSNCAMYRKKKNEIGEIEKWKVKKKSYCLDRGSNPRLILMIILQFFGSLILNEHGYAFWRSTIFQCGSAENGWKGLGAWCLPSQRGRWIFLPLPYLKSA